MDHPAEPQEDARQLDPEKELSRSADQVMRDLDESDADVAAGRVADGSALLDELREMAARLEAKIASRRR